MDSFNLELLNALEMAVFEATDDGAFKALGRLPEWFHTIYEGKISEGKPLKLSKRFLFLANFLEDAHELWNSEEDIRLKSGTWTEKGPAGREIQLEAVALNLGSRHILIVQCGQYSYKEKKFILSKSNALSFDYKMLEAFEHQEQEIRKDMAEKLETEMQSLRDEITILKKRLATCEQS